MSPDEVRSFREVTLMLRHINAEMAELKQDVQDAISAKKQLIIVCLSTVAGPAVVAALKYVFVSG